MPNTTFLITDTWTSVLFAFIGDRVMKSKLKAEETGQNWKTEFTWFVRIPMNTCQLTVIWRQSQEVTLYWSPVLPMAGIRTRWNPRIQRDHHLLQITPSWDTLTKLRPWVAGQLSSIVWRQTQGGAGVESGPLLSRIGNRSNSNRVISCIGRF